MFIIGRGHRAGDRRQEQRWWLDGDWRGDEHRRKRCRGKNERRRYCGDWRLGRSRWLAGRRRERGNRYGWRRGGRGCGDRRNAEQRRRNRNRRFVRDRWHNYWGDHQHCSHDGRGWRRYNRRKHQHCSHDGRGWRRHNRGKHGLGRHKGHGGNSFKRWVTAHWRHRRDRRPGWFGRNDWFGWNIGYRRNIRLGRHDNGGHWAL